MQNRIMIALALFIMIILVCASTESFARLPQEKSEAMAAATEDEILLTVNEMDESRGAANSNSVVSTQSLGATTSGNTLSVGGSLHNGEISFANTGGSMGSYVMNTGNNSTINSAISLNVQITSAP